MAAIVEPFWPIGDVDAAHLLRRVAGGPVACFWLMIVSSAIAVLPVCRSPMISWRWPRPIGVMASIALMPVCIGSCTDCRCITVGACSSSARRPVGLDLAEAVDRVAQRVDDPAEEAVADGHREHLAGAADRAGPPRCRRSRRG